MRAAVFESAGTPLVVRDVAAPECGADDLVIEVKRCGICGSDLHMADVHEPGTGMAPLPRGAIMGHEFSGEIAEVGKHVEGFAVGNRVTALPYIACGKCQFCLNGEGHRCAQARYCGLGGEAGAYAEFMRIGPHQALVLPDGVDYATGALVEPLAVALHGVNAAALTAGDDVLVMGAGPIGLATALWCRYFGARNVIVSDMVDARLDLANRVGATATVNAAQEDVVGRVKQIAGRRPNVVIECIGVPGTQQLAMDYAPANGRIVVVGVCMAADTIMPVKAITKELTVRYVFMYRHSDFEITLDLLNRELIDPSAMFTREIGFDEFPAAFESLKTDKTACKVLLVPD